MNGDWLAGQIGLLLGLFGAVAGGFAALYALGFFQYLGGKKRPKVPPVSRQELINRIMALNDPSKPYRIRKGDESDLVAEWKIVDAEWYGVFNKSGLNKAYRALMQVDESRHTVRCCEEIGSIAWTAGLSGITPRISYSRGFFRGRILYSKAYARGYGLRQLAPPEPGKVYEYSFDINEIRGPIILTVEENGWEWVPVTAKRHITRADDPAS